MMSNSLSADGRLKCVLSAAALVLAVAAGGVARADERKFVVLLAKPSKSMPDPNAVMPNPNDVYDHYFDFVKPGVDSFAEYWHEISYGNVHVSGNVYGWVEVPWPILPAGMNVTSTTSLAIPQEVEESFNEGRQMYQIDGEWVPGLIDRFWTPGERFRDLNENEKYDSDISTDEFSGPEPFEDFLRVYVYTVGSQEKDRWLKLDPSDNNSDEENRQWAEDYIRANYPGDADALIARCGNGVYDGPDAWNESSNGKMQDNGCLCPISYQTPPPTWDYELWWDAYWKDKHAAAGIDPPPPTPPAPVWSAAIPDLAVFDVSVERPFQPNVGVEPDEPSDGINPEGPIYPDATGYYDGPAEFDDLPSSRYHARSISGLEYGGDGRLGEVTSPRNDEIYGQDFGAGDPSSPAGPDGIIPAGGPLAYNVHGTNGYDAGNVLNLEYLTTRLGNLGLTTEFDVFKHDYNLDGLLDQGTCRSEGTENYICDTLTTGPNDGGPSEGYPHNRRRLMEDVVAALDSSVDWDEWVMTSDGGKYLFGTILLPAELYPQGLAAGGRGLFQLPAPAMDLPIQVRDIPDDEDPILFSDFATSIDGVGDSGLSDASGFQKALMSHEFLHVWEGYPDLYDYDVYSGGFENFPVGIWDVMSGAWVHPCPVLKQFGTAGHEPWLQVNDLTTLLRPLVETPITLTDYAFDPVNSAYYYDNGTDPGERFYFWRPTRITPQNLNQVNFNKVLPGDGVMIMHTDLGNNPENLPLQARIQTHFTYNIIQADGLQQLDNGENTGDGGDPFPGTAGTMVWNHDTDPHSRWWNQGRSGISITNIQEYADHSIVTFLWEPRLVPELRFLRPPGGIIKNNNYELFYEAFDFHGGTTIELYFDRDRSGFDGTAIGAPFRKNQPQTVRVTTPVPLSSLPGDGQYYFYARLVPGPGPDGIPEPSHSVPHASRNNRGHGEINDIVVDLDHSKLEAWTLMCIDDEVPGAELWKVEGTISGVQPPATTGVPYTSTEGGVSFRIDWAGIAGGGPQVNVSNAGGMFRLTDPSASFQADTFKPFDRVRILAGPQPGSYPISEVASPTELVLGEDPGDSRGAGGVSYRVHSFRDGDNNDQPDIFTFLTTGKTPHSLPVKILHGQIVPQVYPVLDVTFVEDHINPLRRAPVRVRFDASRSRDELGQPNPALTYQWDLGDGATSTLPVVEHMYSHGYPDGVTVTLTVTNPASGLTGTETVTFVIRPIDDALAIVTDVDQVTVPEGGTNVFHVKLSKAPGANVTVNVARYSGDTSIRVLAGAVLTFTPDDWDTAQEVTLAASEDGDYQPGEAVIRCSATGLAHKTVTAIEEDNDEVLIVTDKTTVVVAESGTATFRVRLAAQPLEDLTVDVQRADGDPDITIQSGDESLDFTPANWNVWQTVTLAAAEDDDAEPGQATIRCSSPGLAHVDVIATEQDNDSLEIQVGNDTVTVPEGGTAPLNIRLGAPPPGNTVVTVTADSGDGDITVSAGAQLTFTTTNWKQWQAATLAAAEDPDALNGQAIIRCRASGMDDRYVTAIERENDRFEIVTDTDALDVPEGGQATFQVRLGALPNTSKVEVTVERALGDSSIMVMVGQKLTFKTSNWNVWQTVRLEAAEDPDLSNGQAVIRCSGPGLPNHDVVATEQDTDRGRILSNRTEVRVTEGGQAEFLVKLAQRPAVDLTVRVSRLAGGDADLSVFDEDMLTFTPTDWDVYQKVILAAAEDSDQINGQAVFRLSADGLWPLDVIAHEEDNDSTPIVTSVSTVEVPESGMAAFRVKLGTIPAGNVTIAVSVGEGDGDITVVSGTNLTFTPANWSAWQTVTLAAAEDDDASNGTATIRCRPSSGPDRLVTAVERDKDVLAVMIDAAFLFVPEGGTASFRVRLTARPLADLAVAVFAAEGDRDIAVTGGSVLTFTPANWSVWQTVRLAAAEDSDAVGDQATIRCVAAGLAPQDLQVAEQENDADNQAPVAQNQTVTVAHNTATVIQLAAADADNVPAPNTYVIVTAPAHGTLSGLNPATGRVIYTPADGYSGPDSFTFKADDGDLESNIATVTLTVQPAQGGTPNPSDADGDTVPDAQDVCPGTPAGAAVDPSGCADSQLDADNDGVSDADDACPNTAAGASVDADGCSDAQNNQPPDDSGQPTPDDNTQPRPFSFCGLGFAQTLALGLSGLLLLQFHHRRRRT